MPQLKPGGFRGIDPAYQFHPAGFALYAGKNLTAVPGDEVGQAEIDDSQWQVTWHDDGDDVGGKR